MWLTSRSLRGEWKAVAGQVVIRVCENPAIAEPAAERLGPASLPAGLHLRPALVSGMDASAWSSGRRVQLLVTADRDSAGTGFLTEMLALTTATECLQDVEVCTRKLASRR